MLRSRVRFIGVGFALSGVMLSAWWLTLGNAEESGPNVTATLVSKILAEQPARSGLCVQIGARNGDLLIGLTGDGRNLVHGLSTDAAVVARARTQIEEQGLSGLASVEQGTPAKLPYADSLVSVLVADTLSDLLTQGFSIREALRVLRPGGVAWLGNAIDGAVTEADLRTLLTDAGVQAADVEIVREPGLWAKVVKPRPATMDEWTHPRRDATANPVSTDQHVAVPSGVRWAAGPNWPTGYRKSAVPGVVVSGERLVYVFEDEIETERGYQRRNSLIARDPFNGLLLWKRATTSYKAPLVCIDRRVYTVVEDGGPLVALDADTGEVTHTYAGTKGSEQTLYVDGLLLVQLDEGLGCIEAETGALKWQFDGVPTKFIASTDRVFVHTDSSRRGGPSQYSCLNLKTGKVEWSEATDKWSKGTSTLLFYFDGVLLAATSRGNQAVDAASGKLLWTYEYPLIGHGGSYSKTLATDGLIWVHAASTAEGKQYAWEGLDPRSGKVTKRIMQPEEFKLKHRCSSDVATERYFLCGSMDFADLKTGEYRHFEAARNSCASAGMVPANGLLYTFPHACGCYAMLRGYLGLVTEDVPASADELFAGERLTKGPAFGRPADFNAVDNANDWPTYRHDAKRSGGTTDAGPKKLNELWSAQIAAAPPAAWSAEWDQADGGRVSAPVVAGGLALTAATEQHRLLAFDVETGKERWSFTAGGRIDCPPTVYNGHCLLGARDGSVYCLRLHDGELAWRFQAAPRDRRIVAYGQLESAWPVVGGVLVYDELVYFTVGRHAGADGGVFVGALEPETGKLVWAQRPEDYDGVPDVLNGDGGSVQMASWEFDAKNGKHGAAGHVRLRGGRLGLLNDAWYDRPIAMRKNLQLWTTDEDTEGQLLAFHNGATAAFSACSSVAGGDGKMSGNASLTGRAEQGRAWTVEMPLDVRMQALVLASERLYAAGLLRDEKSSRTPAPVVRSYGLADGKLQDEAPIQSPPVHDGMIVAGGRLFIATQSGKLICLGEK